MPSRVEHLTVFCGRVTLWLEGQDSQSDYFPALHDRSQRDAVQLCAEHGFLRGAYVESTNGRQAGTPEVGDYTRARKLAGKIGIPLLEDVRFPYRHSPELARADFALEPALSLCVIYCGETWRDDGTGHERLGPAYRACITDQTRGFQRIETRPIEVVS